MVHVLHGTHMLPIEFPDLVLDMVHDVYDKAGSWGVEAADPSVSQAG